MNYLELVTNMTLLTAESISIHVNDVHLLKIEAGQD